MDSVFYPLSKENDWTKECIMNPEKIICGIEECEDAIYFWNCGIK